MRPVSWIVLTISIMSLGGLLARAQFSPGTNVPLDVFMGNHDDDRPKKPMQSIVRPRKVGPGDPKPHHVEPAPMPTLFPKRTWQRPPRDKGPKQLLEVRIVLDTIDGESIEDTMLLTPSEWESCQNDNEAPPAPLPEPLEGPIYQRQQKMRGKVWERTYPLEDGWLIIERPNDVVPQV